MVVDVLNVTKLMFGAAVGAYFYIALRIFYVAENVINHFNRRSIPFQHI
jgi:hypothetical protein